MVRLIWQINKNMLIKLIINNSKWTDEPVFYVAENKLTSDNNNKKQTKTLEVKLKQVYIAKSYQNPKSPYKSNAM